MTIVSGRSITLSPFTTDDISKRYLGWLTDPEVNAFSRRSNLAAYGYDDALNYLKCMPPTDMILKITMREGGDHVGNLRLSCDGDNQRADISILIGEKRVWGRGIGREAIYLSEKIAFRHLHLHRVDAGSANPAFIRAVHSIGWRTEGVQRERIYLSGSFRDWTLLAHFESKFNMLPAFEL